MISEEYLFRINSREQIARWVIALRFFRFIRAGGGLLNDGDLLQVRLRCADAASRARMLAQLDVPSDTTLPAVITINGVSVSAASVPDGIVLMISDANAPYAISDASVIAAQKVEEKLAPLARFLIDPPDITAGCICPQRYPEFWPPRFQYRWPIKWHIVVLLLPVAALIFMLASTGVLPFQINMGFGAVGLLVLAGVVACLMQTLVLVDAYGDFVLCHVLFGLALFKRRISAPDVVQLELRRIPVRVAPGRNSRNTHALWLVHRGGAQPIHQDDELEILEKPAEKLAEASGWPLVHLSA